MRQQIEFFQELKGKGNKEIRLMTEEDNKGFKYWKKEENFVTG